MPKRFQAKLAFTVLSALLVTTFVFSVEVVSEAPQTQWSKTYGGLAGYSVIQTADEGYLVAGSNATYSSLAGGGYINYNTSLVKTNALGDILWQKTYQFGGDFRGPFFIIQTKDGGYALAGTNRVIRTIPDYRILGQFCLVKLDSQGNLLWNKTYEDEKTDYVYSFVETNDGGYALAGTTMFYDSPPSHGLLIKTDSMGNIMWNTTYAGNSDDFLWSVIQTNDGGLALVGTTASYGPVGSFWLIKTDSYGVIQWQQFYYDNPITAYLRTFYPIPYARSGIATKDGGYMLVGSLDWSNLGTGVQTNPAWIIKTDSDGNALWNKTYQTNNNCFFNHVVQTNDGGYIFSGESDNNAWVVKTDPSGNMEWNATYEGYSIEAVSKSIVETADGGYALVGTSSAGIWLVKIAPELPYTEAFPITWIVAVVVIVAVVGLGLIVYFTKVKKKRL